MGELPEMADRLAVRHQLPARHLLQLLLHPLRLELPAGPGRLAQRPHLQRCHHPLHMVLIVLLAHENLLGFTSSRRLH